MKLNKIFLTALLFLLNMNVFAQTSQDNQPSKAETLDWIKQKINLMQPDGDDCSLGYPYAPYINNNYIIMGECESVAYDYKRTWTAPLSELTSFSMKTKYPILGRETPIYLYFSTRCVKIVTAYKDGEPKVEYTNSLTIDPSFVGEGDFYEYRERFAKALRRLVYLNTKDKPKEPF